MLQLYTGIKMAMKDSINRRLFFKVAQNKTLSFFEELIGRPQFTLESLWELNRDVLGKVIPKICEHIKIISENNCIMFVSEMNKTPDFLFKLEPDKIFIFNLIDSQHSIDSITERTMKEFNILDKVAYQSVRNFFLYLVKKEVCVPSNNVGKREWLNNQ